MKKPVKIFFGILSVVFVCIFLFSAYRLYGMMHEYKVAENKNDGIRKQYVTTRMPETLLKDSGIILEDSPIEVDFDALLAQNSEVNGWLYCADSPINYPVAQGKDNDYYLHRLIDGSYSGGGTLFLDFFCEKDYAGRNSVVYGHHMNDGSMFASLSKFRDQAYYDAHPVMYLNTPNQNFRLDLFSGYITNANSDSYTIGFLDDEAFQQYLDKICSQSDFESTVQVTAQDRIVTLSTCSYEFENARYVVHGKLVPISLPFDEQSAGDPG